MARTYRRVTRHGKLTFRRELSTIYRRANFYSLWYGSTIESELDGIDTVKGLKKFKAVYHSDSGTSYHCVYVPHRKLRHGKNQDLRTITNRLCSCEEESIPWVCFDERTRNIFR